MQDRNCIVSKIKKTGKDMFSIWLKTKPFNYLPGQFAMIEIPGHTLRRPLAIACAEKNLYRFIFKINGSGTKELSELKINTTIRMLAPLGNSFPVSSSGKKLILIGGGTGSIAIFSFAKYLNKLKKKPIIIIGAKNKKELPLKEEFSKLGKLMVATDDGSCGKKCNTAHLLNKLITDSNVVIYSCGPHGMLKAVHDIAKINSLESYASVEERMACGIGACVGCVVRTKDGLKKVCKDGPVFSSYDLFGEL